MRPYGYKKMRNPPGDGCHLCMRGTSESSKRSKTANRRNVKEDLNERLRESNAGRKKENV